MKKRILALVIAAVICCVTLLPLSAFAAGGDSSDGTEKTYLRIMDLAAPKTGEVPDKEIISSVFTAASIQWEPDDGVFQGDTEYSVTITLEATETFSFDGVEISIGNSPVTVLSRSSDQIKFGYTFPVTLPEGTIVVTYDKIPTVTMQTEMVLSITASHNIPADKIGTLGYQWYKNTTNYIGTAEPVAGATSATYTEKLGVTGTWYYYCVVSNTVGGVTTDSLNSEIMSIITVIVKGFDFGLKATSETELSIYHRKMMYSFSAEMNEIKDSRTGATWYRCDADGKIIGGAIGEGMRLRVTGMPTEPMEQPLYYKLVVQAEQDVIYTDSIIFSVTLYPAGMNSVPFDDIPADAWYRGDVEFAFVNGIINGKSDGIYAPNDNMTIAEAVKIASVMHEIYNQGRTYLKNATPWYAMYMEYAILNGIIDESLIGRENERITRELFAAIFYKAVDEGEFKAINTVVQDAIPDVPVESNYSDEIYAFYRAGVLTGSDAAGNFLPKSNIRRSEVAAIISRIFDMGARKTVVLP